MKPLRYVWVALLCASMAAWAATDGERTVWTLVVGSFLSGIMLTFTPCVLPMVPIVSAVITADGDNLSRTKGVVLALAYVAGTVTTYALMGALAGATGEQLQAYVQNRWVIGAAALLFALMALSLLGLFTLQLPVAWQSRIDALTRRFRGGALLPVYAIGAFSALILGACVSPVLISFLGVAIAAQDAVLGAITMAALASWMGVPLLLVGAGAGALLPKAGAWMQEVKTTMGVLLMAVAVYLFETTGWVNPLALWGVFLILTALFWGVSQGEGLWRRIKQAIGVLALIWGVICLVGAAQGNTDIRRPLGVTHTRTFAQTHGLQEKLFKEVTTLEALKRQLKEAKASQKPVLVYVYSDVCRLCRKMKAVTWQDPAVRRMLREGFVALRVNITDRSDPHTAKIKRALGVFGTPAYLFFDEEGERIGEIMYGYQAPDEMVQTLDLMR